MNHPIPIRPLLQAAPPQSGEISTPEAWAAKRAWLRSQVEALLGEWPAYEPPPVAIRIYEDVRREAYRQLKIGYLVAPDEEVRAYLLMPHPERRRNGAAILCLHGTLPEAKDSQIGLSQKPGRDYGRFLAEHGFITLSPDHLAAGERQVPGCRAYDTRPFYERYPHWSATGKAIWDGQRALDVLSSLEEVDPARLGAVGHSLGGHGSMFVAMFDERLRAIVSSCGLTTWANNPNRLNWARDDWYCYIPKLRPLFLAGEAPPVDLHEFAALVAPRAFLNISGMADPTYGNNETLPEVGRQLHALYRLLGAGEAFAHFLFGGGHDVPHYSRLLTLGWFEYWLAS